MTILKGKLTHIMAGLSVLYGIVSLITGWTTQEVAVAAIWAGLTVFGVRRALPQ